MHVAAEATIVTYIEVLHSSDDLHSSLYSLGIVLYIQIVGIELIVKQLITHYILSNLSDGIR